MFFDYLSFPTIFVVFGFGVDKEREIVYDNNNDCSVGVGSYEMSSL